jgi:hypothetical protein
MGKCMDQSSAQLALGLIFGILFLWFGALVIMVSYPLTTGNIDPRKYNYRPWQPKWVKGLTDDQANKIGKRGGKWGVGLGITMVFIGLASLILAATGQGFDVYYLLMVFLVSAVILIIYGYADAYKESKQGTS